MCPRVRHLDICMSNRQCTKKQHISRTKCRMSGHIVKNTLEGQNNVIFGHFLIDDAIFVYILTSWWRHGDDVTDFTDRYRWFRVSTNVQVLFWHFSGNFIFLEFQRPKSAFSELCPLEEKVPNSDDQKKSEISYTCAVAFDGK